MTPDLTEPEVNNLEKRRPLWQKIVFGIVIVFVILFVIANILRLKYGTNKQESPAESTEENWLGQRTCEKNTKPTFTANFTDTEMIDLIAPIGGVMVGSPARSYVFVKDKSSRVPLYAPADATLEGIVFARRNPNDTNAPGEYRLDFRASCEVDFHFDHLDEVSPEIKALAPTDPASNTREAVNPNLKVKAGQLVGYSNGTDASGGFDFYLLNSAIEIPHINPKRWTWDQTTKADCPYDYFSAELKDKYYGMFRSQDRSELITPSCGSVSHDLAGTASGGWFQDDSDSNTKWLEFGNINGKTEIVIRENGAHTFSVRDYTTTVLPDKLTVGNSACYTDSGKWMYVKVDSNSQLSLVRGSGSCPASFPATAVETWER